MTEKKISRRGFIKGLAACSVAIPFVPDIIAASPPPVIVGVDKALEGSDNTSVYHVDWNKDKSYTIRKGLPRMAWRHLETGKVRYD